MAKRIRAHKRSQVKKAAKRKAGRSFFAMFGSRSKFVAAMIASALLGTVSLAYWNTRDKQLTLKSISSSEATKKPSAKNVSPADFNSGFGGSTAATLQSSGVAEPSDEMVTASNLATPRESSATTTSGGWTIQWVVTDQLGTPRMIFDESGSLATMTRHDYLPFGEELFAGTGGRTPQQGYSASDNVRQKFTQKERDNETGLDYFGARYYGSMQGRFTSPDPSNVGTSEFDPQSWNGYAYVGNTPLVSRDPDGLWKEVDCSSGNGKCWESDNKNDTISSLAKILHVSAKDLNGFFQNPTIHIGDAFDVSGLTNHLNQASGYTDPNAACTLCRANGAQIQRRMAYDAMLEGMGHVRYGSLELFGWNGRVKGLLSAASAAEDVRLLGTARMNLLNAAEDSKLRNFIKYLYREGAEVGNGSTADAIRYERMTGQLLSATGHAQKGREALTGLNNLLLSGKLSSKDALIAHQIVNDLRDALK